MKQVSLPSMQRKGWLWVALEYVQLRWAGWLFIAVLAVGAVWSARIALQSKPFDLRTSVGPSLKHEPDFEATKLDAWRTNADGTTRTHIVAEKIVHYRDDLSSTYVQPRFTVTSQATQTDVQANAATARNDGEELTLQGAVQIRRKPLNADSKSVSLDTSSLALYPDSGFVTSRSPSVFKQGARTVVAHGGFDYRDTEADIALLGPVKATILPVKK